jgi:predicted Fe-Mo cluster-binding NifX family protein
VDVDDQAGASAALRRLTGVSDVLVREGGIDVMAGSGMGAAINRALAEAGIYASAIVPKRGTLEDVFLELTEGTDAPLPS